MQKETRGESMLRQSLRTLSGAWHIVCLLETGMLVLSHGREVLCGELLSLGGGLSHTWVVTLICAEHAAGSPEFSFSGWKSSSTMK